MVDPLTLQDLHSKLAIATEALRKAEERATAGQLALEVMHEIRSPLEALGYLIWLTVEQAEEPETVRTYMRQAEEQLTTLTRIANWTLGVARDASAPSAIDLAALAEAALRIHQRTILAKRVHLVKDLPQELVVQVYTGEMLQVISNLIVNALDAMPANGTLCLRLRKSGGEVRLLIADNGHGIPKEHFERIFQPFFTTKNEQGTGLGLALSKKIIDRNRGKIRLRSSVTPGRSGTTFRISIPA
jgi:signal transduction histidine kinase